jgi:glyoxylase-like metal-dependent hydrolase (beta-lactamase superfamily II)
MGEDVWPGIRRVLAPNPSALTGDGTNTWIIGTGRLAIIDPGPALPAHLDAVLAAVGDAPVEAIFVTHAHRDHSALAPSLARATGAPVLAFAWAKDRTGAQSAAGTGEGYDAGFRPDIGLADGAVWRGAAGEVRALHTPGHLGDHLCLLWEGIAFSGDHVMDWATSVIAPPDGNMGDYMASLARLEAEGTAGLFPGHGPVVVDPAARIAALVAHRRRREAGILEVLDRGPVRIAELVSLFYSDLAPGLRPAAAGNVHAHLLDLARRGIVAAQPPGGADAQWHRR